MKQVKTPIATSIEPMLMELRNRIDMLQSHYEAEVKRFIEERAKIRKAFDGQDFSKDSVMDSYRDTMETINDKSMELKIMIDSLTNALGIASAEWLKIVIKEKGQKK
jgi:hypothetical protein